MSKYQKARHAGHSHEYAVLLDSQSIVDEELEHPRPKLEPAELHTLLVNTRQDVSAIAILLSQISARQRDVEKWIVSANVLLLGLVLLGVAEILLK